MPGLPPDDQARPDHRYIYEPSSYKNNNATAGQIAAAAGVHSLLRRSMR
jgi:hypothetical protein